MTFYHKRKEEAQAVASRMAEADPRIALTHVSFEPYNGWRVVIRPHYLDLSEYADRAEIQDGVHRPRPPRKMPPPLPDAGERASPPRAARGGPRHECWSVIDKVHHPGIGRDEVLAALAAAGYDPKTSSRQYRHWLKSKGLWKKA